LLVLLDGLKHEMTVVSAGHMGPMVRRADGRIEVIGEEASSYPIGIEPGTTYRETRSPIEPGDTVILYTDGVNEAMSPHGSQFGFSGLIAAFRSAKGTCEQIGEAILGASRAHAEGRPQCDDITLLCFSRC
jgi:serine phosphatase RsbU (regulator of sigma subunit)